MGLCVFFFFLNIQAKNLQVVSKLILNVTGLGWSSFPLKCLAFHSGEG